MPKPSPIAKAPPDPKAVFNHALRFMATDTELRKLIDKEPDLFQFFQFPGMVISAFASELYLKCLLLLDGKGAITGHNLKTLYNKLSPDTKAKIEAEYATMMQITASEIAELEKKLRRTLPKDLNTALTDCGLAFEQMRYIYEQPKGAAFYITHLPLVLHKVIVRITAWDKQATAATR